METNCERKVGALIKRKYMRTRQLQPGMKIDQSIVDRLGRNLVTRGSILDEYVIQSMLKMGVMNVYIQTGEADPEDIEKMITPMAREKIEKLRTDDRSKVTLSDSVRERVSQGIQYMYNNTDSEDFANASNSITNDLMAAIDNTDAIAIDISALKTSDEYTFKHSVDVATIAMILAKQQGLSKQQVYDIGVAGLLHDVGKTKVPLEILNKPGRLDDSEFAIMKQHSVFGYRMIKERGEFNEEICLAVLQHHEKINGKGYPVGFTSDKITPYARLLSVADIYDALVTERPYKKAFSQRDAVEMIMSMTEELDIDAMHTFLESMILYPVDSVVELSNGELAKVVKNNPHYILRPTVVGITSGKVYNLGEDMACNSIIII
jgi:putative nucleotidyltransferase with HDIG domain